MDVITAYLTYLLESKLYRREPSQTILVCHSILFYYTIVVIAIVVILLASSDSCLAAFFGCDWFWVFQEISLMLMEHPSLCSLLLADPEVYGKLLCAYNGFTNDAIARSTAFDWVCTLDQLISPLYRCPVILLYHSTDHIY